MAFLGNQYEPILRKPDTWKEKFTKPRDKCTATQRFLLFFAVENNVCYGFVICGLYYVEVGSFYAYFLEGFFFIMNGYGILSKAFSASIERSYKCIFPFVDISH